MRQSRLPLTSMTQPRCRRRERPCTPRGFFGVAVRQIRFEKRKTEREALRRCSRERFFAKSRHGGIKEAEDESREISQSPENEMKSKDAIYQLHGIPQAASNKNMNPRVTFVLEGASLVPAYVGRALVKIMDSGLTMAGRVHAVYIKTDEGVLIKVEPQTCIPGSLEKFCEMMSQLLQKFRIKSKGERQTLMSVVKNPLTQHLPVNSLKIGFSFSSEKTVQLRDYVKAVNNNVHLVFVVGAMACGKVDSENVNDFISISEYPLSAWTCLNDIVSAAERKWNIL